MNELNRALLRAKKQQALDRIYTYHLRPWCGSVGNTFFIGGERLSHRWTRNPLPELFDNYCH